MAVKRDCYEILGVDRNADEGAIKKAYRRLAKKYHPDTNAGNGQAEEKFKEITEAYGILSDPQKRKLYDRFGYAAFDGAMGEGGFYGEGGPGTRGKGNAGFYGEGGEPFGRNFWENFGSGSGYGSQNGGGSGFYQSGDGNYRSYYYSNGEMGDGFDSIFREMFGNKGRQEGFRQSGFDRGGFQREDFRQGSFDQGGFRRGTDVTADVSITFDEAAFGCEKVIRIPSEGPSGGIQSLKVKIPAGIDSGKSIRLGGKGRPGAKGGPAGDLLLRIHVGTKPGYERKEMDVYTTVTVPFATAVLGGEARVSTLYGDVMCKIKAGTQSGTKLRLKGKGIVSMKNAALYGDHYVTVEVEVPRNLSGEAKKKLREFEAACKRSHGAKGAA